MRKTLALLLLPLLFAQSKRPLNVDDIYNIKDVRDPQRSPDGKWVAYSVSRAIKDTDKNPLQTVQQPNPPTVAKKPHEIRAPFGATRQDDPETPTRLPHRRR